VCQHDDIERAWDARAKPGEDIYDRRVYERFEAAGVSEYRLEILFDDTCDDALFVSCLAGCPTTAIAESLATLVVRDETRRAESSAAWDAYPKSAAVQAEANAAAAEREQERLALLTSLRPRVRARSKVWLIANHLARGVKQLTASAPFAGKSLFEFSRAIAIASGKPWCGYAVTRGPVMIVALDGKADDDHLRRLRGLAAGMDVDFDRLVDEGWLQFYDPTGEDGEPEPLKLDDPDRVARFLGVIDALGDRRPVFVVIDTLTRARGKRAVGVGNDMLATDEVWEPIEQLAARDVTVSVLHHLNKKGAVMGSEASSAAADVEIHLSRDGKRSDAWISVTGAARSPCRTDMTLRFVGGIGADGIEDGSPIVVEERTTKPVRVETVKPASQMRDAILACLPCESDALYAAMKGRGYGNRNAVLAARKALADDEKIIVKVDGVWQRSD
jgi:AAA domain